jgi:hypothetical protein
MRQRCETGGQVVCEKLTPLNDADAALLQDCRKVGLGLEYGMGFPNTAEDRQVSKGL